MGWGKVVVLGTVAWLWACQAPPLPAIGPGASLVQSEAKLVQAEAKLAAGEAAEARALAALAIAEGAGWPAHWALARAWVGGDEASLLKASQEAVMAMVEAQGNFAPEPYLASGSPVPAEGAASPTSTPDSLVPPATAALPGAQDPPGARRIAQAFLLLGQAATALGLSQAKLGQKAEAKGRYQEALEAYQKALAWRPGHPAAQAGADALKATLSFI